MRPRPAPTRICGGIVHAPAGPWHERERGEPARHEDDPAGNALDRSERSRPDTPDDDRGQRHHRDDDAGGSRRQPPAVHEQQDDEEERRDEPARDEEESGVRSERRRARQAQERAATTSPRRTSSSTSASGTCARKIDSHPSSCVRIPPAAGPSAAPSTPAATQTRRARSSLPSSLREQVERGRHDQRRPDRLDAARADEHLERWREPAHERRAREDDDPNHESVPRASPGDVRSGNRDDGEHEVERREHPRHRRDRNVEVAEDLRERERDDRGVGEGEPDPEPEQRHAHGATLGTRLPCRDAPRDRGRSHRRCVRRRCGRLHAERPGRRPSRLRDAEPSRRPGSSRPARRTSSSPWSTPASIRRTPTSRARCCRATTSWTGTRTRPTRRAAVTVRRSPASPRRAQTTASAESAPASTVA